MNIVFGVLQDLVHPFQFMSLTYSAFVEQVWQVSVNSSLNLHCYEIALLVYLYLHCMYCIYSLYGA